MSDESVAKEPPQPTPISEVGSTQELQAITLQNRQCHLLCLPRELRDEIWHRVAGDHSIFVYGKRKPLRSYVHRGADIPERWYRNALQGAKGTSGNAQYSYLYHIDTLPTSMFRHLDHTLSRHGFTSLLLACRQMYHEILPVIYQQNTLSFMEPTGWLTFMSGISLEQRQMIKTMHIIVTTKADLEHLGWDKVFDDALVRSLESLSTLHVSIWLPWYEANQFLLTRIYENLRSPREHDLAPQRDFLSWIGLQKLQLLPLERVTCVFSESSIAAPGGTQPTPNKYFTVAEKLRIADQVRACLLRCA